jgi:hypothetical protein
VTSTSSTEGGTNQSPEEREAIEAGWYSDPDKPEVIRWWTGDSWGDVKGWGRAKGRVNRLAVAALAFAWALPIGGPPAVVLGALAIQEINDFDNTERGKGIAVWAILIGLLNIAVVVAGVVLGIIALTKHGDPHSSGLGGFDCEAWEEAEGFC